MQHGGPGPGSAAWQIAPWPMRACWPAPSPAGEPEKNPATSRLVFPPGASNRYAHDACPRCLPNYRNETRPARRIDGGCYRVGSGHPQSRALSRQVVLVDFWASWCTPCRRSFPWLNEMQRKYGEHGLVVIGVNVDSSRSAAEEFLRDVPSQFQIAAMSGKCSSVQARTGWPVRDAPRSITVAAETCSQAGTLTTLAILQGSGAEQMLQKGGAKYWIQ